MPTTNVEQNAVIAALPAAVYRVLADYEIGHNAIIPKPPFSNLEVVEGGIGAGTVVRFHTNTFGNVRQFELHVSEPEPGRVLVEHDALSDVVTTFTVEPANNSQHSRVHIRTEWGVRSGIAGRIEAALTGMFMRSTYAKELRLLAAYLARV